MREPLKLDPERLRLLQRRRQSLHLQSRGIYDEQQKAEQERDLAAARLRHMEESHARWQDTRSAPAGASAAIQAKAWNDATQDSLEPLKDLRRQVAALDAEIAGLQVAYDALMLRLRPLSELCHACERHMGKLPSPRVGTLQGAAPADDSGNGFNDAFAPPAGWSDGSASQPLAQRNAGPPRSDPSGLAGFAASVANILAGRGAGR